MFNIEGGEPDKEPLLPKSNAENSGHKKSKSSQPTARHLGLSVPVPAHSAHRGRFRSVGSSELVPGGKRIRRATFTQNESTSSHHAGNERGRGNREVPRYTWARPSDSSTAQTTAKCSPDPIQPNTFRRHSIGSLKTYGATAPRNPVPSTDCMVSVLQNGDPEANTTSDEEAGEDSSADSEADSDGTFSLRRLSRRQKFLLLNVALSDFLTSCCLSLLAPFFPQEAHAKNVSDSVSGWIFGVYSLTQFIVAPICGKLMPKIGGRFMYLAGAFWSGGCTVLFGFLPYVPGDEDGSAVFVALCFVLRVVLAVGCTALQTAGYAFSFNEFPNSIATVFGILEVFVGLGYMAGPAVGGLLYGLGGFYLPFIVVGGLILLSVPINCCFLPLVDETGEITGEESVWKLLKMPSIIAMSVVVVVGSVIWSVLDPTLEPRLMEFDVSAEIVGLIFLLMSAFYALTAPLWGRIADRMEDNKLLIIPGFIFAAVGMLLLGPSPIFCLGDDYNELWLNLVSLCLLGMSSSLAIIPTFDVFLDLAEIVGFEENVSTYAVVAGLWSSMYALGDFIGPSIGGILLTSVGFQMCMTYVAIACAAVVVLLVTMVLAERCGKKMKESKLHGGTQSEPDEERTSIIKGLESLAYDPTFLINTEIVP